MNVLFITIVGRQSGVNLKFDDIDDAMEEILTDPSIERVSFGGMTSPGRSGITLHLEKGGARVNGHKIDPIPEELLQLVTHISLADAAHGLDTFANGTDILIGNADHGILLKWCGPGIEVFGAGHDTESPH